MMGRANGDFRIRIAYLIDSITCETSGTEKQLLEIIKRLDKMKFAPHLICLRESDWLREHSLPCPCTVLDYTGLLKFSLPKVVKKLRRVIVEQNIQLVQTFFEDSIFVAWLATGLGRKSVVLLSSRRDMGLDRENMLWYHKLFSMVLPLVNKSYDGIVANSQQVKEYVTRRENTPREKIEVIYNGVRVPEKAGNIPQVFEDNPSDIWVVIVASLTPVKRHDLLVKAVASLTDHFDGQKIKVLVLGKGSQKKQLVSLIKQENVHELFLFEGAVHNVTDYLQHCDIGVLCSDREGFSNAILEYMACGLPVLATAVGGNVELVNQDNGICVPADNPKVLADALSELIVDKQKRKQMGWVSRKRVEDDFSWKCSMQHLEGYYERIILEKGMASDQ